MTGDEGVIAIRGYHYLAVAFAVLFAAASTAIGVLGLWFAYGWMRRKARVTAVEVDAVERAVRQLKANTYLCPPCRKLRGHGQRLRHADNAGCSEEFLRDARAEAERCEAKAMTPTEVARGKPYAPLTRCICCGKDPCARTKPGCPTPVGAYGPGTYSF